MKRVLLLEPNYSNKYPPMGLMKLATYHRLQGDCEIVFYKGDLKEFVLSEYVYKTADVLNRYESDVAWLEYYPFIKEFLKSGTIQENSRFEHILDDCLFARSILEDLRKEYRQGGYFDDKPWDRVCVTTLFTFYWKITIETIEFAKKIIKDPSQLMVGGIMASVVPEEVEKTTGVKPFVGCIYDKFIFNDKPIEFSIDALPLDYSILEEVDYIYPENNGYYGYTTRGCVNRCPFCAVPKLEPNYQDYIPLKERIDFTREHFGEQKNLLLLDNNVFASKKFDRIIDDIYSCGFERGAKYTPANPLEVVIQQLELGWNDRAYIRKGVKLLNEYVDTLKGSDYERVYRAILDNNLLNHYAATKDGVLQVCRLIRDEYSQKHKRVHRPVSRYVDFNQGVDARLATEEKIKKLSSIAIRPLRVAFDNWAIREKYVQALYYASQYKITTCSNYLLYNFKDEPVDLYNRLLLNVDLSMELGINIYSFPMKYHPITDPQFFSNRDYLGEKWSRKEIRTIQVILNATKGKVGSSRSFFFTAFGRDQDSFQELLRMPEAFILKRFDAEVAGLTDSWRESYENIKPAERVVVDDIVKSNNFTNVESWNKLSCSAQSYLNFYLYDKDQVPLASNKEKNKVMEEFVAKIPSEISSVCRELMDKIKDNSLRKTADC